MDGQYNRMVWCINTRTIRCCFEETKIASNNENGFGHLRALVPWLMMMITPSLVKSPSSFFLNSVNSRTISFTLLIFTKYLISPNIYFHCTYTFQIFVLFRVLLLSNVTHPMGPSIYDVHKKITFLIPLPLSTCVHMGRTPLRTS